MNKLVKAIYARLDQFSLVVQKDGDSGDSCYRTGLFAFLLKVLEHPQASEYYKIAEHNLRVSYGIYHRTANPTSWAYNPNNLSRDNASKLMLAVAINNDNLAQDEFYDQCHHRTSLAEIPMYGKLLRALNWLIGFHQNVNAGANVNSSSRKIPDLIGIDEISNVIRSRSKWWLYPILCIYDVQFLIGLYARKKQVWDFDSLMAVNLIYALIKYPTPLALLARMLYSKTDYKERIAYNYSDDMNGMQPLGDLYVLACKKFIDRTDV